MAKKNTIDDSKSIHIKPSKGEKRTRKNNMNNINNNRKPKRKK